MLSYRVTVPPTWEPVSVAEARAQCRVIDTSEDLFIAGLIAAAREHCEELHGFAYSARTMELYLEEWPECEDEIALPHPPLVSVASVKYYGTDDTEYTLPTTDYYVNTVTEPGQIHLRYLKAWPTAVLRDYNAVCITYTCGYATPEAVPEKIKLAIKLLVGHWFENREDSVSGTVNRTIENGVARLLGISRLVNF